MARKDFRYAKDVVRGDRIYLSNKEIYVLGKRILQETEQVVFLWNLEGISQETFFDQNDILTVRDWDPRDHIEEESQVYPVPQE